MKKIMISALFALLANPLFAESVVGSWNCQARGGDAAIGRNVTYHADGRMTSRMTVRINMRRSGRKGFGEMTVSHDGRFGIKGTVLTEKILNTHDPVISFTAQGKKTVLRGPESNRVRRAAPSGNTVTYAIRKLTSDKMELLYIDTRGRGGSPVRVECRRTNG